LHSLPDPTIGSTSQKRPSGNSGLRAIASSGVIACDFFKRQINSRRRVSIMNWKRHLDKTASTGALWRKEKEKKKRKKMLHHRPQIAHQVGDQ
jgi:hypothetical protein